MNEQSKTIEKIKPIFYVLSNKTRLKILLLLKNEALSVGQIEDKIGASQSLVSHQLAILRSHNLVSLVQEGKSKIYQLSDDHIRRLLELSIEHANE